ncbi:hypothetical protein [Nitrosopumilus sp. S6]
MKKIRILVVLPIHPSRTSETTLIIKNILGELRKKSNPHIIWLVYSTKKIVTKHDENETIIDIHDYKNFVDILKSEKPDLVYATASYSLIDFAASSAARYLGIPVLSKLMNKVAVVSKNLRKSVITRLFETSLPTDENDSQKQFMKRGKFYFYKWKFLVNTLIATKKNKIKSLMIGIKILKYNMSIGRHEGTPEFANDMHWLESNSRVNRLIELGYKSNSLVVTGNPMYDHVFQKLNQLKKIENKVPVILFIPTSLYEHGIIPKKENEIIFKKILEKLNENKKIKIKIKIHPSSQQFSYYKEMTTSIDEKIEIFQEGELLEYVESADLIVSYSGFSTTHLYALLSNKPLILLNIFEYDKGPLLQRNIAVECKNIEKINELISSTLENNPIDGESISNYIEEFFYKTDGKAAERLSDIIIKLIKKS